MLDPPALRITTPSDREIVMSRAFSAPRALVFDAWTKPHLLKRWYGAHGWDLVVCEVDLRVGGAWRYVSRGPDGTEMTQRGVCREVVPPERLVTTQRFDPPWSSGQCLVTTTFVENAGRTTVTTSVRYPSRGARDSALRTPMRRGLSEGYARLDALLSSRPPGGRVLRRGG
jgi:uncharacterized protein YndB with AHSA1/START domain